MNIASAYAYETIYYEIQSHTLILINIFTVKIKTMYIENAPSIHFNTHYSWYDFIRYHSLNVLAFIRC